MYVTIPNVILAESQGDIDMPNYNYKCPQCEIIIEQEHKMDANPAIRDCPECKVSLFKMFTFGGVTFNGDGFYSNDKKSRLDIG
jgi:putative FmdB family regulatory protein